VNRIKRHFEEEAREYDGIILKLIPHMLQNVSRAEMENTWLPKYYDEDCPAKLTDHLARLAEVGFADVDVAWKYYNYAVYGGKRA
jgi:hypothetical protein